MCLPNFNSKFNCSYKWRKTRHFSVELQLQRLLTVVSFLSLHPLVGKASQFLRVLEIDLLDMDGAIPEAALRPSKVHLERRWAWRLFVKSAETIYEVLMALQAAALLPSAFTIPKEGKSSVSLKDSSLFGISLVDHVKAESSSSALRFKKESNQRKLAHGAIRAQTAATTTLAVNRAAPEGKKTLRKGSVVITGASSRLGLATAKALAETGIWHVIMGCCRDFLKAERAAKVVGIAKENYIVMHLDLASLDSVSQFVDNFKQSGWPVDVLVCNAAVYLPTAKEPNFTAEGFELSVGTNHLGHFLLSRLMLDDLKQSNYPSKRLIIVSSITG